MNKRQDIEIMRGDTLAFTIESDGDIGTVNSVTMTARDSSDAVLFTQNATVVTSGRKWSMRVPPASTATVGVYNYDVQMTIGSDIYTPLYGCLLIHNDVTR